MIVILDYGMGNPGSILNMLRKAGGDAVITCDKDKIDQAQAIILPGVGAFDNGMQKLNKLNLIELLNKKVIEDQVPFLGVCLGMHLLFESSEEGTLSGLCWIDGSVTRFNFSEIVGRSRLKVPHMGWNLVYPEHTEGLFGDLTDEARFYFVHSYHVNCKDKSNISATSNYGYKFTCAVQKNNIFGAQFHPEKSHRFGLAMFKNFLEYTRCYGHA
jgi:glutamine amidotransferase